MKKANSRVAVLGAGIMGSSLAVYLARKGADITLIDKAAAPFSEASRWNEGKIHMGYIYAADPSLQSAKNIMGGGLAFRALAEEMLETSLEAAVTKANDVYLCHRDSIVSPEAMGAYIRSVTDLLRRHPASEEYLRYFPRPDSEALGPDALAALSG